METGTSTLSNSQLAEHYANCIKLSSQNVSEAICLVRIGASYLSKLFGAKIYRASCVRVFYDNSIPITENQFQECVWTAPDRSHVEGATAARRHHELPGEEGEDKWVWS